MLSASHHGSRTFFKNEEDDEPYTDHMEKIGCQYVVISAPKRETKVLLVIPMRMQLKFIRITWRKKIYCILVKIESV